jgi:hypothetical protein
MPLHPAVQPLDRAEVRRLGHVLPHDHAKRMRRIRLDIVGVGADVADVREGEGDDLARERRVGHDLLVSGHRGVETHLAHRRAFRAETAAPGHLAVRENQNARGPIGLCGHGNGLRLGHGLAGTPEGFVYVAKWRPLPPSLA